MQHKKKHKSSSCLPHTSSPMLQFLPSIGYGWRGIGRWDGCGCCDDCGGCYDDWVGWVIGVGGGCCDDWLGWVIVGGGGWVRCGGWVGGAGSVGGVGWVHAAVAVGGAVSVDGGGWVDGVGWVGGAGSGCWGQLFRLWLTSLHMLHFLVMPCFVICFPSCSSPKLQVFFSFWVFQVEFV